MLNRFGEIIIALALAIALIPPAQAATCPEFDPTNPRRYSRQADGSCAGLAENEDVSGTIGLVSFTIGRLENARSPLTLWVPRADGRRHARLSLRAHRSNYRADGLPWADDRGWDIYRNVAVPAGQGWAIARDDDDRYVPVFVQPGDYQFTLHATAPAQFPALTIQCSDREVWRTSRSGFEEGLRSVTWNGLDRSGRTVAPGRCQFRYQAELEQNGGRLPERRNGQVNFWRNPRWLRN